MKLYIIGNGFDLHHKLQTSYNHYRDYLLTTSSSTLYEFERFDYFMIECNNKGLWSDLERSLTFDFDELIPNLVQDYYPNMLDDSDSRWHNMEIEARVRTGFIESFVGKHFLDWIKIESMRQVEVDLELDMDKDALYINFNYTDTLSRLYGINKEKILHVHGSISDDREDGLIFGSGDNDYQKLEIDLVKEYEWDEFYGATIEPMVRTIVAISRLTSKNIRDNYDKLCKFIPGDTITEVIIMGHSINESSYDYGYYEDKIIKLVKKEACWTIYWHSEEDKESALSFIRKNEISNYKLIEW